MKYLGLYAISLLLMGLVIGGAFEMVVQKYDFWMLALLPLIMIWLGWKLYANDEKIIKGLGLFIMFFIGFCYLGILFSERFRSCICDYMGVEDYITILYNCNLDYSFWKITFLIICDWILMLVFGVLKNDDLKNDHEDNSENSNNLKT